MKKFLFLAVLLGIPLVASATTASTKLGVTLTAAAPSHFSVYTVKVTQNGKLLTDASVATMPGDLTPLETESRVTYLVQKTKQKDGSVAITSGRYTTGASFSIETGKKNPDLVSFRGAVRNFVKMDKSPVGINIPEIETQKFEQVIDLPVGKTMRITGWSKNAGTTVVSITHAKQATA